MAPFPNEFAIPNLEEWIKCKEMIKKEQLAFDKMLKQESKKTPLPFEIEEVNDEDDDDFYDDDFYDDEFYNGGCDAALTTKNDDFDVSFNDSLMSSAAPIPTIINKNIQEVIPKDCDDQYKIILKGNKRMKMCFEEAADTFISDIEKAEQDLGWHGIYEEMIPGYSRLGFNETAFIDSSSAFHFYSESENDILREDLLREIDSMFPDNFNYGSFSTVDDVITEDSPIAESDAVENIKEENNVQPYTPDSDHCYSQPVHLFKAIQEEPLKLKIVHNRARVKTEYVEPEVSGSSDDEVDVVTVTEEDTQPAMLRSVGNRRKTTVQPQKNIRKQPTRARSAFAASKLLVDNFQTAKNALTALKIASNRRTQNTKSKVSNQRKLLDSLESSPSSSQACSDIEDYEKRNTHNDSERKRREAQRTALQNLRDRIPELKGNTKAAKVLILNTATKCIKQMDLEFKALDRQRDIVLYENTRHMRKLKKLRRWLLSHT